MNNVGSKTVLPHAEPQKLRRWNPLGGSNTSSHSMGPTLGGPLFLGGVLVEDRQRLPRNEVGSGITNQFYSFLAEWFLANYSTTLTLSFPNFNNNNLHRIMRIKWNDVRTYTVLAHSPGRPLSPCPTLCISARTVYLKSRFDHVTILIAFGKAIWGSS